MLTTSNRPYRGPSPGELRAWGPMRAMVLDEVGADFRLEQRDVPVPGYGEALVEVLASGSSGCSGASSRRTCAAQRVFRDALLEARETGELRSDADVEALASLLVAVMEGLHVLAKGTRDRRQIKQAIAGALPAL